MGNGLFEIFWFPEVLMTNGKVRRKATQSHRLIWVLLGEICHCVSADDDGLVDVLGLPTGKLFTPGGEMKRKVVQGH